MRINIGENVKSHVRVEAIGGVFVGTSVLYHLMDLRLVKGFGSWLKESNAEIDCRGTEFQIEILGEKRLAKVITKTACWLIIG